MPPLHSTQNNTDKMGICLDTLIGSTGPRIVQRCSKTVQCLTTAQSCSVMLNIKWVTIMGWNGGNDAVFCVVWSSGSQPVTLPWMLVLSLLFCYVQSCSEFSLSFMVVSNPRDLKTALQHSCNGVYNNCDLYLWQFWGKFRLTWISWVSFCCCYY